MNDDLKVTVTLTAEDLAFYDQAKAAGIPSMLVSMYSGALKRLVASAVEAERDRCILILERLYERSGEQYKQYLHAARVLKGEA